MPSQVGSVCVVLFSFPQLASRKTIKIDSVDRISLAIWEAFSITLDVVWIGWVGVFII